jgi:DNA-binding MarR family transcriptional regulator
MLDESLRCFPEATERYSTSAMFALRSLARRISDYSGAMLAPFKINAAQYNYMTVLYMTPGHHLTLTEISELIHTSNATVTSMAAGLEQAGFIRKKTRDGDARYVVIQLTAKGKRTIEAAFPVRGKMIERAFSAISINERKQLCDLLQRLAVGFDSQFETSPKRLSTKRKKL